ncbi:hypothetical protein IE81DRAFT_64036 [Ceraceosorus guamensis]|uniref:Velvet domain-containing protein n=1 Tax=Ceraceosorus guamensis TaxID=1522189 RepID=A0A316VRV4_9BASI|nr:hypothetical protein IE81DRAFT_64036 [Ceraceosorus guamensis]PWN38911.1 hypothetical protein IE81DRAFT_64036 [Ceraceosorus guamensis]
MPRPRNDQMSERRRRYALSVVQQPSTGCAFGTNLLSRVSVSPPLILRLRVSEPDGAEVLPFDELPFMLCQLRLVTATGQPADMLSPVPNQPAAPDAEESGAAPSEPPRRPIPRAQQPSILQGSADGPAMEGSTPSPPRVPTSHSSSPAHAQSAAVPVRMLYGNMVAFGVRIPETQGQNTPHGIFFVFPDISIRSRGRFRLVADLNRMPK